ncbi:heterokaryon incompatibility protein [Colletotrichum graminicola M1.001]|uniref:Heterokaryon incompatibility protein n=1 Tax=Colletotrichum graminicola (strain M1.001 / M2 / FGSC 10212) TaxID=645133 RepID=E3Q916_COLGM|nr:heterokaryon incompatibility protein [Colletotrichum graminicola M1.001]EFQ27530.1 heterokaryon incompatibility protein [Colletotrichum graminicola M1.001]
MKEGPRNVQRSTYSSGGSGGSSKCDIRLNAIKCNWNNPSCRRLDVFTSGGISSCLSCGSIQLDSETSPSEDADTDNGTVYQPLVSTTDIRLLTLLPGNFDDRIKRHLSFSSTASMIDYEAISYTWASNVGEIEWTECITLDRREFLVTPKCMMALRLVRSRGAEKAIWMDAVCMNQKDAEERGHQVRLMPRIFSRAQHVLIYVGEPAPEEERLLQILHGDPISTMPLQPLQVALETFLQRPYFSRAWVLQEVALAKMATLLPSVLQFRPPSYRDSSDLLHLLDLARHGRATDPRDKLFAVFGLVSCADADGVMADYTRTTEEVYMRMAGWIVQRFGVPAMLVRASHLGRFSKPEGMRHDFPDHG